MNQNPPIGRLSVMMFLQYAIWGAWLPLLWPFLTEYRNMTPEQVGNMFAIGAIGAIIAPFIAGQIADRWFATEKFLALSHIVGGVLVWQLASIESYSSFLVFSLIYSVVYSPTLPLTNSLAFHHLDDIDKDFGRVRVWGTVGWIAVGIAIGQWLLHMHAGNTTAGMADAFRLSGMLGIAMGAYCLTLPKTPPAKSETQNATGRALSEIKRQPLITLFLLAVPVSCIHQFYFVHTAGFLGGLQQQASGFIDMVNKVVGVGGGGLMTIGQMSEIAVLAMMPVFASKLSRKQLLALGLIAYAVRMALFANHEAVGIGGVMLGVAMHGFAFGCFIFVAFMVVDENTSSDVRASAQSLFNLVIIGIGTIVGSKIATSAATWSTHGEELSFNQLFSYPMWASVACLAALLIFYPNNKENS